ncbi:hypothetical protein QEG73_03185 [Chitinophagaceae bacterium 26-R-25]|nr:hypothetical protein [Chitinophagaceae bacterium 26-R-25]
MFKSIYKGTLIENNFFKRRKIVFLFLILASKLSVAQDLYMYESGSLTLLEGRKNISNFNHLLNADSSSELQILYVQLDNPKFGKLECYFFKIDSNGTVYKCRFKDAVPDFDSCMVEKKYNQVELPFVNGLHNTYSVVEGKDRRRYYSVYLIVKRKNKFAGFLFTDVSVQSAVDNLTELVEIRKAFEILQTEFYIRRDEAWDG